MKRAIIEDTGPSYAAADPDDQYHRGAQQELERRNREQNEFIAAYPTLLESYTLVLYRLGKQAAATWLDEVLTGVALLNPTPEDYRDAAKKVLASATRR